MAFEGADGFVLEIYSRMERLVDLATGMTGIWPSRLGHVTFACQSLGRCYECLQRYVTFAYRITLARARFCDATSTTTGVGMVPVLGLLHHYAWGISYAD